MPYKKRREKIYVCEECGFSTGDVRLVLNLTQMIFKPNPTEINFIKPNPYTIMTWKQL